MIRDFMILIWWHCNESSIFVNILMIFNTMRSDQEGPNFAEGKFKRIFKEIRCILNQTLQLFYPEGPTVIGNT